MPTELETIAKAINDLRLAKESLRKEDPAHLTRLCTLLRHFELLLLGTIEHGLNIR
jgi:hypothetical protein